jgi:uncharacterized protein DUF4307
VFVADTYDGQVSAPVTDLAERYGAPSRARRPIVVAVAVLLAVAGLAWLAWAMVFHPRPAVSSQLVGYHVLGEHKVTATFTVVRRHPADAATCAIRATAADHAVVGQTSITVRPGPATSQVRASLRTERRATTVDLVGCTSTGSSPR